MIKLLSVLSPYQVEIIVKEIRKDHSLLIHHEINQRAIYYKKIYDIFWLGEPVKKREKFIFPVTENTFRDNIDLLRFGGKEEINKSFGKFKINDWDVDVKKPKGLASLVFLQASEFQNEHVRRKNEYIHPLTPKELEKVTERMCCDKNAIITFDINWELIYTTLLRKTENGRIQLPTAKIHNAGNMEFDSLIMDTVKVIKTYAKKGWHVVNVSGDYTYFTDKRKMRKS